MIRAARIGDIFRVVDMVSELRASVCGAVPIDRPWTARTLAELISNPDGAVWVSEAGFLAASIQRSVVNPAPIAVEHGWFAKDGSGLKLLRFYESWARKKGASFVTLSTGPVGPDLSRLGYRRAEQAWVRVI